MKKKFVTIAAVMAVSATAFGQEAVRVDNNGDVSVGRIWGQSQSRIFDVKGIMSISHVPDPETHPGFHSGVYFDVLSGTPTPIMRPQWTNTYWIGNSTDQMWRVHSDRFYANGVHLTSDLRRKSNFRSVENSLERILRLKPHIYDLEMDTNEEMPEEMKQNIINSGKNHIGFVAQEMKEDFPLLVELDKESDRYSVNYIGLIPEIVKSLQELNEKLETKIAALEAEVKLLEGNCCDQSNRRSENQNMGSSVNPNEEAGTSVLYQNNPNPFNAETNIKYYLAPETKVATMYIYDMNGKQIDKYELSNKGENDLRIQKGKLSAGIYFYTLIADGKEVATKKMILTD